MFYTEIGQRDSHQWNCQDRTSHKHEWMRIIINCSIIVVQLEKYQYFITFPPPSLSSSPSTKIEGVLGLLSFEYLFGESAIETEMDILLQLLFSQRDSQTDRQTIQ